MSQIIWHKKDLIWLLGGVLLAALVIYLTPLKNLNMIEPRIKDVPPAEFYKDFSVNPEKYVFIDVRPEESYAKEHAKGSINIPLTQMYFERTKLPKSGKTIALICTTGISSGVAYGYLEHYGFLNLRRIQGGIEAWRAAGLPVESSPFQKRSVEAKISATVLAYDASCPPDVL